MAENYELGAEENEDKDEQGEIEEAEHLPIRCDRCQELSDELQSIASRIRDHGSRVARRTLFQLSQVEAEYKLEGELLRSRNSTLYELSRHHRREHEGEY